MASVEKFTDAAVTNQLRHNAREIITNSNKDIDKARTHLNYSLTPERSLSPRAYYTARKQELYVYGRKDVKTMAGWIVTAPKELTTPEEEHEFFISTYNFLENPIMERKTLFRPLFIMMRAKKKKLLTDGVEF